MANRLVQQTVIIDSAMGNALILASANMVVNMSNLNVNAVGFVGIDSTSLMTITGVNTGLHQFFVLQGNGINNAPAYQFYAFPRPMKMENLKVPVLTNATGWLYLA